MRLFFGAEYGSRFAFSPLAKIIVRRRPAGGGNAHPRCILMGSTPFSIRTKNATPDGVAFFVGAGYGSRTRLHGLGSRCITDIRTLRSVGIIAKGAIKSNPFLSNNGRCGFETFLKLGLYKPHFFCYNPNRSTQYGPVVQSVSTPACHAGGRRFESVRGRQNKDNTAKLAVLFLFSGPNGLERPVQANSPVNCLPGRGFSAEKRVRSGSPIIIPPGFLQAGFLYHLFSFASFLVSAMTISFISAVKGVSGLTST